MADDRPGDDIEIWTGPPSRATRISYAIVRGLILVVAKIVGRIEVVGAERIPAAGAYILAPVHRSNVDFALTSIVTKRPMRYMGKDSIWKSKPLGRFVSMLGAFPVHRGSRRSRCHEGLHRDHPSGGSPLVMFPEGTRQSGPVVQEMFDGTTYVAAKADVPIIPMGIGGTEAMMPKGSKLLRPTKLVLVVGDPIPPPAAHRVGAHAAQRRRAAHRAAPPRDPRALRRRPAACGASQLTALWRADPVRTWMV